MKKTVYSLLLLAFMAACSPNASSTSETESPDSVAVATTSTSAPILFQSEADVRAYLCAHKFKSDEGDILRFTKEAQEIDFNDMPVAVATQISEITDSTAVLKGSGVLGDSTIKISLQESGNVLEDVNDGVFYWEQK